MKNPISCCYFPTSVMFIDDNENYLESIVPLVGNDQCCEFYVNPREALAYLEEEYSPIPFIEKWLLNLKDTTLELGFELEDNELTHSYIDIDIGEIYREIYSAKRFAEVSVVVTDYAMPEMSGVEFCRALKDHPVKRILLTGQASKDVGIQAFNEGVVDRFIVKGEDDLLVEVNKGIEELQHEYFAGVGQAVLGSLSCSKRFAMRDPACVEKFLEVLRAKNICEYYLINDAGSFLMLDKYGHVSWFIVQNNTDTQHYYDFVYDNEGPKDLIKALKDRNNLLFLFERESEFVLKPEDWQKWRNRIHPAETIKGRYGEWYCAVIDGPSVYNIRPDEIVSYQSILEQR
ncbi:MAG: response regulator [Gammaproteobacteria bacterium]|nr:response regulator [Gammaproteobacteria bacterium]